MTGIAEPHRPSSPAVRAYFAAVARRVGQHPYASLLGLRSYETEALHQRVMEGLPYAALERLRNTLDLPAATMAEVLHIPPRTFQRRKEEGRLRPDESDRLLRLTRLLGRALELFGGDAGATRRWLDTPLTALGGARPLELARSEPGASEVEALIGRLEHGVFA